MCNMMSMCVHSVYEYGTYNGRLNKELKKDKKKTVKQSSYWGTFDVVSIRPLLVAY